MNEKHVLVGAEGSAELEQAQLAGVRRCTPEEEKAYGDAVTAAYKDSGETPPSVFTDGTGRPYWLWAVNIDEPSLPDVVRTKAKTYSKVVRLTEW